MFVVVYDVANRETFKSLGKWIQEAANATPGHQVPGKSADINQIDYCAS